MIIINTFYIDESGSMTKSGLRYIKNQYFVICVVLVNDEKRLKRVYKRFVSLNMESLRREDKHYNMFYKSGKFKELKGAYMSYKTKKNFVKFFCKNQLFSIFYICSSNQMADNYFYSNKARAFNYLIRLCIELVTAKRLQLGFLVEYFQSERNELIQIADVFSNIYYSYIVKGRIFDNEINYLRNNKYIKNEFYFPFSY